MCGWRQQPAALCITVALEQEDKQQQQCARRTGKQELAHQLSDPTSRHELSSRACGHSPKTLSTATGACHSSSCIALLLNWMELWTVDWSSLMLRGGHMRRTGSISFAIAPACCMTTLLTAAAPCHHAPSISLLPPCSRHRPAALSLGYQVPPAAPQQAQAPGPQALCRHLAAAL